MLKTRVAFCVVILTTPSVWAQTPPAKPASRPAPDAVEVHVQQLRSSASDAVRLQAVRWLDKTHQQAAVSVVYECMLHDPSAAVRAACSRALGTLGDRRAVAGLVHSSRYDPDTAVQQAARSSLQMMGHIDAVTLLSPDEREERSRSAGRRKLAGILVTSIGTPIGLALLGLGLAPEIGCSSYDGGCDGADLKPALISGAVLAAVSLAVGVPLWVTGAMEQSRYEGSALMPSVALQVDDRGAGLAATWTF